MTRNTPRKTPWRRSAWKPTEHEVLATLYVSRRKHGTGWFEITAARELDVHRAAVARGWLITRTPGSCLFHITPQGLQALAPYVEAAR